MMRIEVLRSDMIEALQRVQYSASGKGLMPILSGIKIEALEDGIVLSATDLESYGTTSCIANVEEKGSCVVSLKTLLEYFRDSSDEKIIIACEDAVMRLEGKRSRLNLLTMPVEDFPASPEVDHLVMEGLESNAFFKAVQKVSRAASKDEKRPTLTGIYIEISSEEMRLVSTDSYRLAISKVRSGVKAVEEDSYIISASSLINLAKATGKDGKISIFRDENKGQVKLEVGELKQVIRLIEGKFPKYEQFIPEETKITIDADRKEWLEALRRVSLVSNTIKITTKQGLMILEGESREVGEGREEVETTHQGEEISIAFNAQFLEDGLQSLEGERALMGVNEPLKPGLIKEREGDDYKYVIMPIRI